MTSVRIDWPVFEDARGTLVPIEFGSVPFAVERAFFVRMMSAGQRRGDHVTSCDELVVLVAGSVRIWAGDGAEPVELQWVGASLHLQKGTFVVYESVDEHATILVLASDEYRGASE